MSFLQSRHSALPQILSAKEQKLYYLCPPIYQKIIILSQISIYFNGGASS